MYPEEGINFHSAESSMGMAFFFCSSLHATSLIIAHPETLISSLASLIVEYGSMNTIGLKGL